MITAFTLNASVSVSVSVSPRHLVCIYYVTFGWL